ncbi:MAG TPA: amidase [Candidatus Limnocylindrales bacterium]
MVRRSLVLATLVAILIGVVGITAPDALAASSPTSTRVHGINVDATTIPQLENLMNRHRLTSVQLVQFYLHRIKELNPKLHAVITVSRTALADARRADAARRNGDRRTLLGIPIIVKDNIDTTGMPTTAGSWALAGSRPHDAFIVRRLKAAGAIIIAKANLSEWANFRSNVSSSGWSGIGGQTNMPYVLDRNPCGSSSGSGVAAAADLATAAVGTETDGSIVCPSGANGDVGIKPTLGLLSRNGIIPISADQDTAGPIARNVTDAAVLLGAMTGVDPRDPATAAQAGNAHQSYRRYLDKDALHGARIGIWRNGTHDPTNAEVDAQVNAMMDDVAATLRAQGATVVDPADIDVGVANTTEFPALLCEFKSDIETYLRTFTRARYPKTLADLIAFNDSHPALEGPWDSDLWRAAEATGGRDAACAALRAQATPAAQAGITNALAANHLDAIVGPTNSPAWLTDPVKGDLSGDFSKFVGSSGPAAVAGYAAITVPAAFDGHLPLGITFTGGRWDEPKLIGLAYSWEQATHVRVPPTFLAHETASAAATQSVSAQSTTRAAAPARRPMLRLR